MGNNNGAMAYQAAPVTEEKKEEAVTTAEEKQEEAVTVSERKITAEDYEGKRADFSNNDSLTEYGNDIIIRIKKIIDATANMESASGQKPVLLTEKDIGLISKFDETIKEEAEKKVKVQNSGIFQSLMRVIKKVDPEVEEKEARKTAYQVRYGIYCGNLDKICEKLDNMILNSNADNQLREDSAQKLIPAINQLEAAILQGYIDLDNYKAEKQKLMDEYIENEDNPNPSLMGELKLRQERINLFSNTLSLLQRDLESFKDMLNTYALQQVNEYKVIQQAKYFKEHQVPVLKGQGSAMILNQAQAERILILTQLNDQAAKAVLENTKGINDNINKIRELDQDQKYDEALIEFNKVIGDGFKMFEELQAAQEQKYEARRQCFEALNANQEEYQKMARSILVPDEKLADYESGKTDTIQSSNQYVKRF